MFPIFLVLGIVAIVAAISKRSTSQPLPLPIQPPTVPVLVPEVPTTKITFREKGKETALFVVTNWAAGGPGSAVKVTGRWVVVALGKSGGIAYYIEKDKPSLEDKAMRMNRYGCEVDHTKYAYIALYDATSHQFPNPYMEYGDGNLTTST